MMDKKDLKIALCICPQWSISTPSFALGSLNTALKEAGFNPTQYDINMMSSLYLKNNQFTGVIPEGICDLDINWSSSNSFTISNNQLCILPYPSCIEDYVGEQDTSDCP